MVKWKFWKRSKVKSPPIEEEEVVVGGSTSSPPQSSPPHNEIEVSDCIQEIGFGPYQYKVIFVMGLMSFADSSEIWLSSVIIKMLVCEWDLSTLEMALIPACVFFWYAVGSIVAGKVADKLGRWPLLLVAYYVICISGTASGFAKSYVFFIICRSFTGGGIGASYGVSVVYAQEMVPKEKRALTNLLLNIMWIAGGLYECTLAYFLMDKHEGWRYVIFATVVPCYLTLILLHFCDESPRYLVLNGEEEKAREVLEKMARQNNSVLSEGRLVAGQVTCGEYSAVFKQPYTRTSFVIQILFLCNMYTSYGAIFLIPDMMSYGYCYMSEWFDVIYTTEEGCINYTKAEYLFFMVVTLASVPGYIIGPWSADLVGRLPTFYYSTIGGLVITLLLLYCINSIVIYLELFLMLTLYCIFNAALWIYAPEYYPTYIRTTAVGILNGISKLGAAVGVFATLYLDTISLKLTIYTYCAVMAVASLTTLGLKSETRGTLLLDARVNFAPVETGPNYGTMDMTGEPGEENDAKSDEVG